MKEKSENSALIIKAKLSVKEKEIELFRQKDCLNTDAISTLSDPPVLKETEVLKKKE